MGNATHAEDLGAVLGLVLRSYAEKVRPALGEFPNGARGYQTMCAVTSGDVPSQAALAARLGIDRTMMTYLIDDLVAAGLVERRPDPEDRRRRSIVSTDRGRDAVATLCGRVTEAENAALGALDDRERAVFRRLLSKAAGAGVHLDEACTIVDAALAS